MTEQRSEFSSALVVALVASLVVIGLLVDGIRGGGSPDRPTTDTAPLLAGSSTCAALALDEASAVTATTVALPPSGDAAGSASLRVESQGNARPLPAPPTDGGALATPLDQGEDVAAISARWEDVPLLLSRRWAVDDTQRVPGAVEGPCPTAPATEWFVPGVATAGGAAAVLHLANPTEGPASLSVTFTTPDGPVAPTRLANLAVEAHGQITVDLNQFVPEEPDLGVVVRTRAGRVVAEVLQTLEAAVGGVDGRALVPAHSATAETWTIPWVRANDEETAWVWVTNPGEVPTDVRLVLHTSTGPVVPPDSGVTLAPGATQRIDLRGALAEVGSAAVTVRSAPGVPIVTSGAVLRAVTDSPVRSGVTIVEALPASSGPQAALSAVGGEGRERSLVLANPGEGPAVVDVRIVGASTATAGRVSTGLTVPAGAIAVVDLAEELPAEGGYAVLVVPSEGAVAAAVVGRDVEGPLNFVALAARPFPVDVTVSNPVVVRDRALLHPLDEDALEPALSEEPRATPTPVRDEPTPEG